MILLNQPSTSKSAIKCVVDNKSLSIYFTAFLWVFYLYKIINIRNDLIPSARAQKWANKPKQCKTASLNPLSSLHLLSVLQGQLRLVGDGNEDASCLLERATLTSQSLAPVPSQLSQASMFLPGPLLCAISLIAWLKLD